MSGRAVRLSENVKIQGIGGSRLMNFEEALVVMGNESNGISGAVRNEISRGLRIPSFGKSGAESLNVAVATAVTLSEFRRRQ